jgi:hypothetical protein
VHVRAGCLVGYGRAESEKWNLVVGQEAPQPDSFRLVRV